MKKWLKRSAKVKSMMALYQKTCYKEHNLCGKFHNCITKCTKCSFFGAMPLYYNYCVFSHKFSQQSLKAALHFHSHMLGIRSISNQRDRLFLVVYEACTVISQLLNACKTQWEGSSQSLRRVTTPMFQTTEKKPPQSKVYQCIS